MKNFKLKNNLPIQPYLDTDFEIQNKSNNLVTTEEANINNNSTESELEISTPITKEDLLKIRIFYKNETSPETLEIQKISKKAKIDPYHQFKHLHKLIRSENLLFQAASNVLTKKGATTKGINLDTSDKLNLRKIKRISNKLTFNSFKFNPIRRLFIDKTKSNPNLDKEIQKLYIKNLLTKQKIKELKARPLGILTFSDKIVAEAIRIVLNAIYEPEFQKTNLNFGFRPKQGVQEAIKQHTRYAKSHNYMLEADISGAFDNVDHDILINILRKKIADEKLLNLIKKGLKCGIFFANKLEESKIGTTQGSGLSPLLYNIYFHEFDKFISTEFTQHVENINKAEGRIPFAKNPQYVRITKMKAKFNRQTAITNLNDSFNKYGKNSPQYSQALSNWLTINTNYKNLDKKQKSLQSINAKRKSIRFTYTRYADDWILSSNCSETQMIEFKEILSKWILTNLKLDLNQQKSLITNLVKPKNSLYPYQKAKFLGFTMCYYTDKNKHIKKYGINKRTRTDPVIRTKVKLEPYEKKLVLPNTKVISHVNLIISPDKDRVIKRLIDHRFIRQRKTQYFGTRKAEWSVLEPQLIIDKYNEIIRGYINYYCINITYPSELNFYHYLFKYSCLHTLANKYNTTIRGIMKKFGKDINIKYLTITKRKSKGITITEEIEKISHLLTWKDCQQIMRNAIQNYKLKTTNTIFEKRLEDIFCPKINWRTKYKLTKYCCICGSTQDIQYHHVRHIKIGKVTGFLQVMKQLNRKQIPVCPSCHRNIHSGKYNSLKLEELFDERLIFL